MPGVLVDPLDILEAQIEELEKKIIGSVQPSDKDEPVAESLSKTASSIDSAISSYESTSSVFDRIHELGTYLDPSYEDTISDTVVKTKLVLDSEPEIRSMLEQLNKLNDLNDSLNPEPYKDLPSLTEKLRKQSELVIKATADFEEVEARTKKLSEDFNIAMPTLDRAHKLTAFLLSEIEEASKTKKIDRDVD